MPLLIIAIAVLFLLLLIVRFKINAFIALIIVALGVGIAQGMPAVDVVKSIQNGIGGTLGYLVLVLGFGAMLGALIANSGASDQITDRLIKAFGIKNVQWALVLAGFIVGLPLFYTVGFVMLIPIIFAVATSTRLPLLYVGIPMVASLSVTHGFLPPHPAPTAISLEYGADMTLVLLYGIILAIPTIIIAGPIFGKLFRNFQTRVPTELIPVRENIDGRKPTFFVSVFTALIPVILMAVAAVSKMTLAEESLAGKVLNFIGEPAIALLIAVLIATYTLGINLGQKLEDLMKMMGDSVKTIAMILLIIGGGGALKQVLVDSGASDYIIELFSETNISPLVLAWTVAAMLRIALGSATVAALTAAGIATPLIGTTDVSPELLVLATGAGSLTFSQVNDTGFWLFKEYFNLTIWETFRSWTAMETLVSLIGLGGCLLLSLVV